MKMGLVDGFLNIMRLNPDDEDEEYDDLYDDYDDEEEERGKRSRKGLFSRKNRDEDDDIYDEPEPVKQSAPKLTPKITPIQHGRKGNAAGMEVCVFKPTTFEDAREITETLLLNRTVVLNVEGLNIDIAQRIIDFVSGATFAISGNFQKVSNYIFVLTPRGVDISGDFQEILDSFDVMARAK